MFLLSAKRIKFSNYRKQMILEKTNYRCAHCGAGLDESTMTIEHIQPLSKGGDNSKLNIVALCEACNLNKSNSIYAIKDYYGYIKEEYIDDFLTKSEHLRHAWFQQNDRDDILQYTAKIYKFMTPNIKSIVFKQYKKNKKKALDMYNRLTCKLKLEYAYPGDAEDILKYITKVRQKYGYGNELYNNIYVILDTINKGKALVLRRADSTICGLFMFKRFTDLDTKFIQLENIEENTILRAKYIMTYAIATVESKDVFSMIVDTLVKNLIVMEAIPIFFSVLDGCYKGDAEVISIPYEINKVQGKLEFFSINGIKKSLEEHLLLNFDIDKLENKHLMLIDTLVYGSINEEDYLDDEEYETEEE